MLCIDLSDSTEIYAQLNTYRCAYISVESHLALCIYIHLSWVTPTVISLENSILVALIQGLPFYSNVKWTWGWNKHLLKLHTISLWVSYQPRWEVLLTSQVWPVVECLNGRSSGLFVVASSPSSQCPPRVHLTSFTWTPALLVFHCSSAYVTQTE